MELNNINNKGSWSEIAAALNQNFLKILAELLKYQHVTTISGANFLGYFTSSSVLPNSAEAAWAVAGDLKAVTVYAYYTSDAVPNGFTAGWNALSSLGTYDFTDYSELLTQIEGTETKLSELGQKAEKTVVSTYSLMNGGAGNYSNGYKVRTCALDVRGENKLILTTDRPLTGNSYYEYECIFVEEELAIGQFISGNNNPSGFTVIGENLRMKQGDIIEVPSNASAIVVAICEIPNGGSEGDIVLRTTNFGNYRLGYSINTANSELPNIYKSIEDRNNTIAFCRSEIRNGTPENNGNAYAVRSIMPVPVKKGDCVVVQFNGYTLGEGQTFAYGIAGVSDNSINTNIGSIKTEGIGYSETNAVNNSYIVTHDDTRYVLVCVTVKNSDGTYTSLQPYTNYGESAMAVKVIRNDIINAINLIPIEHTNDLVRILSDDINTVSRKTNITLIPGSKLPNINIQDRTFDLGDDPVLMVGGKCYILKSKIETDKFRKIQIKPSDSTSSAVNIVFNTKTFEIESKYYGYTLDENEVIIASFRIYNEAEKGTFDFIKGASIPFEYTIDGAYPQLAKDMVLDLSELNSDMFSNYASNRCNIVFGNVHKVSASLSDYSTYRFAVQVRTNRNSPYSGLMVIDTGWQNGDYAHINSVEHWLSSSPVYYTAVVISKVDDSAISKEEAFSALSSLYVEYIGGNAQNGSLPFSAIDGIANNINNRKDNITAKTGYTFIAHRGFHLSGIPENSLDSYEYAAKYGFKYAETDFCPTLDGELVLMHDESINRTMRNKDYSALSTTVLVKDKTLQELRTNYVLASSDVRQRKPIPTLEEFLITCKNVDIYPIMEIKNFGVEQSHILQAFEMASEILGDGNFGFTSFSPELLDYARTLSDKIKLWYIINEKGLIGQKNTIDGSSREHHNNVWYPATTSYGLTAESVKKHRKKGIYTAVWTIDSNRFNEMGQYLVDQIATDNIAPDLYGSVGIYINSDIDNNRLAIDGNINSDKTITLNTGKSLSCTHERFEFGKYYTKISFSGVIRVNTPQSVVEVNSTECNGIYIEQGFLIKKEPNITITAVSDSVINKIEIAACSIK